jgi:hypothetical protein
LGISENEFNQKRVGGESAGQNFRLSAGQNLGIMRRSKNPKSKIKKSKIFESEMNRLVSRRLAPHRDDDCDVFWARVVHGVQGAHDVLLRAGVKQV